MLIYGVGEGVRVLGGMGVTVEVFEGRGVGVLLGVYVGRGVRVGSGVHVGRGVRVGVRVGGNNLVGVTSTSGG